MILNAVQFDDAAKERIKEAAAYEKRLRLEGYLDVETNIGPFVVKTMLVKHALELEYGENRLNMGKPPEIDDLVHFLWVLRPETDLRTEKQFSKFAVKNLTLEVRNEISSYFSLQFLDMPTCNGGKSNAFVNEYDSSVWLTVILHELCGAYSWTIQDVMNTSMSAALQLIQQIVKSNNPKYSPRNPITQAAKAQEMNNI